MKRSDRTPFPEGAFTLQAIGNGLQAKQLKPTNGDRMCPGVEWIPLKPDGEPESLKQDQNDGQGREQNPEGAADPESDWKHQERESVDEGVSNPGE